DVGSWISVGKYLPQTADGNASNSPLSSVNAQNNIVFTDSGKQVALVGVDDLIVVDTGDALLVTRRSEADNIKKVVSTLPEQLL
ncbi:MAG: mannose-1-phosphate guanyltransferase, partial [Akkermansia sp.]|nr:mannose-1-phosphate guanyltransferase [Akkermansia sp.]